MTSVYDRLLAWRTGASRPMSKTHILTVRAGHTTLCGRRVPREVFEFYADGDGECAKCAAIYEAKMSEARTADAARWNSNRW